MQVSQLVTDKELTVESGPRRKEVATLISLYQMEKKQPVFRVRDIQVVIVLVKIRGLLGYRGEDIRTRRNTVQNNEPKYFQSFSQLIL